MMLSLPELVTSIVAARKGETSLAIGNVIGSNIFNILFILGASALIDPIGVNYASAFDIGILVVVTILVYLSLLVSKILNRLHGTVMVIIYIVITKDQIICMDWFQIIKAMILLPHLTTMSIWMI